jgi:hypothetical protein
MNRLFYRILGLTIGIGSLLAVRSAQADDPVTGPDLKSTKGEPLNPPAPVSGATPKLVGVSAFAGAAMIDMGPVNDRLESAGPGRLYPNNLPILFPILGGQGFGLFNRFLIGGSGAGLLSRSVDESGDRQISASGAWGTFDFGYQLIRVNGFLLAPVLSLGGYGMTVTASDKGSTSFADALQTNHSTSLTNNGFLTGVSLVSKMIVIGKDAHEAHARSGWSLGVRVGGLYGIPLRGWKSDGAKVNGDPPFGLRGGYAALSLGVGTW